MTKDKDVVDVKETDGKTKAEVDAEIEERAAGEESVGGRLATGLAPAWATDPTTNKNAAQRYVAPV